MPAITAPGLASGLDISGIITKLMSVEQQPVTALNARESILQARISAYGSLKGAISAFQNSLAPLNSTATFSARTASIVDSSVATVTASASATSGKFSIEVQNLAQAQKLKSGIFSTPATTIGTGTLTIQFGSYSGGNFTLNPDKAAGTVTINASQSSLSGVRDAINAANIGASASIINDGTGYRLVVSSNDTGLANALKITVNDSDANHIDTSGLSQLAYNATTGGTTNLTETAAALNANAVVDGIAVSKASNVFNDVIEGVTMTLLKANPGAPTILSVAKNTGSIQAAVEGFVKSYNDLGKSLASLSAYDPQSKRGSILTGDTTLRAVQSQLRSAFNTALSTAGGGLTTLSDIGVSFQSDGTLKLDSAKLTSVLNDPTKDISTLFAAIGKPDDGLVRFVSATGNTANGSHSLDITQLATQGKATGNAAAGLTINAGSNDTLNLTIDGTSASITIAAGTYTAVSLAAEIQSQINGATGLVTAGISVSVTESVGALSITSNRYGSASSVVVLSGNAQPGLLGTQIETTGQNVAGTINGETATGSGQLLTATGAAQGMVIKIEGGATGNRGTIHFARGFADTLTTLTGNMLDSDSLITQRIDTVNSSIKDIGSRREALQQRLVLVEQRYRAQFNALDTMISSMNKTSSFLQQQLANLPKAGG